MPDRAGPTAAVAERHGVRARLFRSTCLALAGLGVAGFFLRPAAKAEDARPPCQETSPISCPHRLGHVWTIVLENSGVYTTFGLGQAAAPYLTRTLPRQGAFLPNYYGTGHSSLDNYIAMTSGQAPNSKTQGDCTDTSQLGGGDPRYSVDKNTGQAVGTVGCTYQADVLDVSTQLSRAGRTWKAYNETMDANPGVLHSRCQGPGWFGIPSGQTDPFADPRAAAQPDRGEYRSKHNPFVYYHAVTDDRAYCEVHDVPLGAVGTDAANPDPNAYDRFGMLRSDLRSMKTTPAFSYITPNQCSDGHDDCTSGTPGEQDPAAKLAQMDGFLRQVVPLITSSPAFKRDGLLVITFDEGTDSLACCDEQPSPELSYEGKGGMNGNPAGPGGGAIGAVLLSPEIQPGTVSNAFYNHYSYLRTVEDVFGLSHLGYAADSAYPPPQPTDNPGGTPRPFGPDVFTARVQDHTTGARR